MLRLLTTMELVLAAHLMAFTTADRQTEETSPAHSLEQLSWLAGEWVGEDKGTLTEEHWMKPRGGMMPGMNRSVGRDGTSSFEFMRIAETSEGIIFFASPGGRQPTGFALTTIGDQSVTFEQEGDDFPKRIHYRIVGETLQARIEGESDGKSLEMEWIWRRPSAPGL